MAAARWRRQIGSIRFVPHQAHRQAEAGRGGAQSPPQSVAPIKPNQSQSKPISAALPDPIKTNHHP
jgi:hypothetical protein